MKIGEWVRQYRKEHDAYRLDMFRTFIRRVIVHQDSIEIQYNYTACPPTLKSPVSILLTGETECSDKNQIGAPKEINANSYALYFFPGHFSCKLVA